MQKISLFFYSLVCAVLRAVFCVLAFGLSIYASGTSDKAQKCTAVEPFPSGISKKDAGLICAQITSASYQATPSACTDQQICKVNTGGFCRGVFGGVDSFCAKFIDSTFSQCTAQTISCVPSKP